MASTRAVRLTKDLREVLTMPLPHVGVEPLDDDLSVMHGTIEASPSSTKWQGAKLHFVLRFPATYPTAPPRVEVCTPFPHPNVIRGADGVWEVCLDMLTSPEQRRPFECWSSAFTIRSVLMQLSSFLLVDDEPVIHHRASVTEALAALNHFTLHGPGQRWPVPVTQEAAEAAVTCCLPVRLDSAGSLSTCSGFQSLQQRRFASRANNSLLLVAEAEEAKADNDDDDDEGFTFGSTDMVDGAPKISKPSLQREISFEEDIEVSFGDFNADGEEEADFDGSSVSSFKSVIEPALHAQTKEDLDSVTKPIGVTPQKVAPKFAPNPPQWTVVRKGFKAPPMSLAGKKNSNGMGAKDTSGSGNSTTENNAFHVLTDLTGSALLPCAACGKNKLLNCFSNSQLAKGSERRCLGCVQHYSSSSVASRVIDLTQNSTSSEVTEGELEESKAAAKNRRRRERKKAEAAMLALGKSVEKPVVTQQEEKKVAPVAPSPPESKPAKQPEQRQDDKTSWADLCDDDEEEDAKAVNEEQKEDKSTDLVKGCEVALASEDVELPVVSWKFGWLAGSKAMGTFRPPCRVTACAILAHLTIKDLIAFSGSCKCAAAISEDDWIWKTLFVQTWPRSPLTPLALKASLEAQESARAAEEAKQQAGHHAPQQQQGHWRWAAILEANGLATEPHCFHRRCTRHDEDEVLGLGLEYTTNPKTNQVDYVTPSDDLGVLSHRAYKQDKVRHGAWGHKISAFLPLYLDQAHFGRALKVLLNTADSLLAENLATATELKRAPAGSAYVPPHLRKKQPPRGSKAAQFAADGGEELCWRPTNSQERALLLLCRIMNTMVVLVVDKGIVASERALEGYCQVHRLLIALVEHFPSLKKVIHTRLNRFVCKPEARVKSACPNLGELLPLLSVSETVQWQHLAMPYLKESFDRGVLWACTKAPRLATVTKGDESRLDVVLETTQVSQRLVMFHAAFLRLVARPASPGSHGVNRSLLTLRQVAESADVTLGRPPVHLRKRWQGMVDQILNHTTTWPQLFQRLGVLCPSKQQLLNVLEQAVGNSLRKGYHRLGQDFSRVHRSGVSKLLLKGESYSAPPNLTRVRLHERWRFSGGSEYLDASCLAFAGNRFIGLVDWQKNQYMYDALSHSGDDMDHTTNTGTHTITCNLKALPREVTSLFFTVSSWTEQLEDVLQPSVHLEDATTGVELCAFQLEDKTKADFTSVIMCKLSRGGVGCAPEHRRWTLEAIGEMGYGRATGGNQVFVDGKVWKDPYGPMKQAIERRHL